MLRLVVDTPILRLMSVSTAGVAVCVYPCTTCHARTVVATNPLHYFFIVFAYWRE